MLIGFRAPQHPVAAKEGTRRVTVNTRRVKYASTIGDILGCKLTFPLTPPFRQFGKALGRMGN